MDDRLCIANMAIEAGGKNGIFPVDEKTIAYMKEHSTKEYKVYEADEDAEYTATYTIDLSSLKPTVSFPHLPENTHTIDEVGDIAIDQVVIGSCTNGRIEDLRAAAEILKGRKVKKGLRCIVIPATQAIYLQAIEEGLVQTFIQAGAVVSTPTWQNHVAIFEQAGFKVGKYPYYDKENNGVDFPAMLESLKGLKENTVVILHACCHNPTGYDLTQEQWAQVVDVCVKNKLIPFLDIAYQGFGDGLEEDAGSIRQFADAGIPFFVSSSFSKSFSLYGERIGALTVVCKDQEEASRVMSKLKALIRANYSNPPAHGAKIVAQVLNDPKLMAQWHEDLSEMRERIKEMRKDLAAELKALGAKKDFDFVTQQKGMFSFSGLNPEQVQRLKDEFGVYIVKSGRMCVASLNKDNVKYTAEAIKEVL